MTKTTKDGLAIYDLDPQASELWVLAGPAGVDPNTIDTDNLPDGFRWVEAEEWAELQGNVNQVVEVTRYTQDGMIYICAGDSATTVAVAKDAAKTKLLAGESLAADMERIEGCCTWSVVKQ